MRGPLVMRGYRKDPERTADASTPDGWLHTGDIMTMDDDGFLRIVDRKKDIMINASGKNMSPAHIENTSKAAPALVSNVVVIGEGRPYNTALVVLDAEAVTQRESDEERTRDSAGSLPERLRADISRSNSQLARVEQIKRFRICEEWAPGGEELTLTQKVKRDRVLETYAELIEDMYAAAPAPEVHDVSSRGLRGATSWNYILVHDGSHGAWCWDAPADLLRANGHEVRAIDLPGREDPTDRTRLESPAGRRLRCRLGRAPARGAVPAARRTSVTSAPGGRWPDSRPPCCPRRRH